MPGERIAYKHYRWKEPPYRCIECTHYDECLTVAAVNDTTLDCAGCKRKKLRCRYEGISEEEIYNCFFLLGAIFFPEKYRTYVLQKKAPNTIKKQRVGKSRMAS